MHACRGNNCCLWKQWARTILPSRGNRDARTDGVNRNNAIGNQIPLRPDSQVDARSVGVGLRLTREEIDRRVSRTEDTLRIAQVSTQRDVTAFNNEISLSKTVLLVSTVEMGPKWMFNPGSNEAFEQQFHVLREASHIVMSATV